MTSDDEEHVVHDFGWWPEIVGVLGVALLVGALMVFARGSI